MNKFSLTVISVLLFSFSFVSAQTAQERAEITSNYDLSLLKDLELEFDKNFKAEREEALRLATIYGWPEIIEKPDGGISILVGVVEGKYPKYYETHNRGAGITTRTDRVHTGGSAGLDLNGENMIVGMWDGGRTRASHVLLQNRVTQMDSPPTLSDHATHVGGTLIGTGAVRGGEAKGMAPEAHLNAYDFLNDESEMINAAADGLLVSNHSYGLRIENLPLWYLGYYDGNARNIDNIAYNAPYYLPVTSAGNDRQSGVNTGDFGYDYLTDKAVSKNTLVTAAVYEVLNYTSPFSVIMSNFSSWGPTDDGRIKPDISAKGVQVLSSTASSNTSYSRYNGTSMASPNVAGSLLLLQQHHNNLNGSYMLSSTLRGLVLHTADEAGSQPGPDYRFGWGLMNTERAAEVITNNGDTSVIIEEELAQDEVYTFSVQSDGINDLVASITWTDLPGTVHQQGIEDWNLPKLVNDLDLRISEDGGETFYPWKLNPEIPNARATTGDNSVDNIEKIEIENASGEYIIRVSHKGNLNNPQAFSLIVSGIVREDFAVSTHQGMQQFCPTESSNATYAIDLEFSDGFSDTVNFSVSDLPAGVTATITPTSLNSSGSVILTLNGIDTLNFGDYQIRVTATGSSQTVNLYPILHITNPQPAGVTPVFPADGAVEQPVNIIFSWEDAGMDAEQYIFQLATDPGFTNLVTQRTSATTTADVRNLNGNTEYFWRVKATNTCGEGVYGEVFSFTTEALVGIDENSIDGLVVYPNPARSILNVEATTQLESVEIINVLGQSLLKLPVNGDSIQINTENLRAGNYFIKITTENMVTLKRVIKM